MQKVYLLLRSNQKTGPYSLEELLQLELKPFDLVWVEGRSAGWRYPSEIDSLKPYVVEAPKAPTPFEPLPTAVLEQKNFEQTPVAKSEPLAPKKVFVSMPGRPQPVYRPASNEIETPVSYTTSQESTIESEAIPKYAPGYQAPKSAEEASYPKYARTVNEVEESYTNWVVQKKKKKPLLTSKNLIALTLVIAIVGAMYFMFSGSSEKTPVLANHTETQKPQTTTNDVATAAEEPVEEKAVNKPETNKRSQVKEKTGKPVNQVQKQTAIKTAPVLKQKNESPEKSPVETYPIADNQVKEQPEVTETSKEKSAAETASQEKKKKLGEKIRDIFRKPKAKKEEPKTETVLEDPKPANNRQSTKREEASDAATAPEINIADQIDITSNAPDTWMMGVKGLKVTLRNRSAATIQSAAVEISYYDENNRVLDKKMIYFTNVSPKAKQVQAAPDHKFADHVEFKLGTVSAKDDRFAQN